ncbi:DUF1328 family protein [Haloarchaeobius amylolyticus]|uniref:DUF1328 family protein n=1 Tax=Haloarchaeobius amylolyticus TaxID=1198296 RepID=UPI00226FD61A|nr:DUF1328 family protein [Haloarchaeobius amylolyticus]
MSLTASTVPVLEGLLPLLFSGDFLYYGLVFFVVAIVAGVVGMRGVAGISMEIAKILVGIFLILAVLSLIL